jgi:octaprenyl-diphosphate synthase
MIEQIKTIVHDDLLATNNIIINKIKANEGLIDELANHIVQSGGKRLRPLIVLLASRACNYVGTHHITLAATIEFFHTATLLHDDVIDESTLRRGRETANEIWGSKASILVGDYLLTQYVQLMLEVGNLKIIQALSDIATDITRAEIKQLKNRHNYDLSLEDYFDVIRSKTSLLFAGSASLGALISDSNIEIEQSLYNYGLHLGNAFQLIDDALDYCSNATTIGKNIGDDLADGKATLPILHALKHGTKLQQQIIKNSLENGSLESLPEILIAIKNTQAIEYTREIAQQEANLATRCLDVLPESIYKDALIKLANYALHRDH